MIRRLAALAASTLILGLGVAQAQDYTLAPLNGQVKLIDGFLPDPRVIDVDAGGTINAADTIGDSCYGFITDAPTYRVFYTAGDAPLVFAVDSPDDTTLIISDPDGNWVCDDDSAGSLNPVVTFDPAPTGQYDIWVGTYAQSTTATATLSITAQGGGTLDYSLPPLFGDADLVNGFTPDPVTFEVQAGGPVDAGSVSDSCWGFVTEAPTLRLNYTAGSFPLFISAITDLDAVLVINDPNGDWICDDDSAGNLNPLVTFDNPVSGQYDIWVGTYGGETGPATLRISEVDGGVAPSGAGGLDWNLTPNFGEQDVATGFEPDPIAIAVTAGGDLDANLADEACFGYVTAEPTYRIYFDAGTFPLFISVLADGDATLAIFGPDEVWYCDDDSGDGLNPVVTFEQPQTGVYDIWVGTFGDTMDATLYISEIAAGSADVQPTTGGNLDWSLTPLVGEVTLRAGFVPDPHEVMLTAGGTIDAYEALQNECRGYVDAAPHYRLNYTAGSFPLAFWVEADADVTLVISGPDGEWICDDDSHGSLLPAILLDAPTSGQYDIWVGTYGSEPADATLYISETTDPMMDYGDGSVPPVTDGVLDMSLQPNFGELNLNSGFSPDPRTVEMFAGGDISAAGAADASCRGYVTSAPDFRLNYNAGSWPLIISALSEADTTLVINGPDGVWYCDDDGGEGLNPMFRFETPMSGQYDIWVGTYSSGNTQAATLLISEIAGP